MYVLLNISKEASSFRTVSNEKNKGDVYYCDRTGISNSKTKEPAATITFAQLMAPGTDK